MRHWPGKVKKTDLAAAVVAAGRFPMKRVVEALGGSPVRSPESNGLSEAFVKTFKRDYVRVNPLPDAETALRHIAGWIDDYNDLHPHSALSMRSPREFIRAQAQ